MLAKNNTSLCVIARAPSPADDHAARTSFRAGGVSRGCKKSCLYASSRASGSPSPATRAGGRARGPRIVPRRRALPAAKNMSLRVIARAHPPPGDRGRDTPPPGGTPSPDSRGIRSGLVHRRRRRHARRVVGIQAVEDVHPPQGSQLIARRDDERGEAHLSARPDIESGRPISMNFVVLACSCHALEGRIETKDQRVCIFGAARSTTSTSTPSSTRKKRM